MGYCDRLASGSKSATFGPSGGEKIDQAKWDLAFADVKTSDERAAESENSTVGSGATDPEVAAQSYGCNFLVSDGCRHNSTFL